MSKGETFYIGRDHERAIDEFCRGADETLARFHDDSLRGVIIVNVDASASNQEFISIALKIQRLINEVIR